jgi:hypothetical protein
MSLCVAFVFLLWAYATSGRRPPTVVSAHPPAPAGATPTAGPVIKSQQLDDRNGFKQFTFGMSIAQAEAAATPDKSWSGNQGSQAVLTYTGGPVTRLDDFPLDRVEPRFIHDHLCRIEVGFSKNQDKIFQAFTAAFGPSNPNGKWLRNGRALRARFWQGDNIVCTILAEALSSEQTGWDSVVLSDLRLGALAAASQMEELTADFTSDGFKGLSFGMTSVDVTSLFSSGHLRLSTDAGLEETSLAISRQIDPQLVRMGWYPLDEIRCHFFEDKLYRIDLVFSQNGDEIFEAFLARFPRATANSGWLRGQKQMMARQWSDSGFGAVILAPATEPPEWDRVILFQPALSDEKRRFNDEAPARAAKEI